MPGPGVRHGNRVIRRGTSGGPRQPRDRTPYVPTKPVVSSSRPVRARPGLTERQLRSLSPTLNALHGLTKTDILHTAGASDEGLNHVLRHFSDEVPGSQKKLTEIAHQEAQKGIPELNPKKVGVTLKSGRQIQTTAPLAKALGGLRDVTTTGHTAHRVHQETEDRQRHVLHQLLQKPGKTKAEVGAIGELLREYHPKEFRDIEAAYQIHQLRQQHELPKAGGGIPGIPTLKPTQRDNRRFLKNYEHDQKQFALNAAADAANTGFVNATNSPAHQALVKQAHQNGLINFLGDLIPDTPAEIAAAAAGGYLVRGAGGALIRVGAKAAVKEAAAQTAEDIGRGVSHLADRALEKIVSHPKIDKLAFRGSQAAEKSAPALRAGAKGVRVAAKPVTIPSGYAARHPGQSALGVNVGPGVVAAAKTGKPNAALAPAEGYYQALTENPGKVAGTTLRSVPGLLTAPIGLAANAGKSVVTGSPKPLEANLADIKDFGVGMAQTFASGDPNRIAKAIEDQYGLTPLVMAGIPGSKLLARAGVDDAIGATLRKIPGIRRAVEAQGGLRARRADRLNTAKAIAYTDNISHAEIAGRTGRNAVPGLKTIVEHLNKSDRKRTARDELKNRQSKVTAEHLVKTLAEQGLTDRSHVADFIARHGHTRHPEAPAERLTNYDIAQALKKDPAAVEDPHIQAAVTEFRRMQKEQGYETSAVAKYLPMGITHGVTLPWDRYLTERAALGDIKAKDELVRQSNGALTRNDVTAGARKLHPDLVALDAGAKATMRKTLGDKGRADFVKDTQAVQHQKGLAEPAWTSDADVRARSDQGIAVGNRRGYRGRGAVNVSHQTRGILQQMGLSDQSGESLVTHSIVAPRRSEAINASTAHLMEQQATPIPVGPNGSAVRVLTEKQAEQAVRDGLIDPDKQLLLDSQNFKSALLDPRIPDETKLGKGAIKALKDETAQHFAKKLAGAKGMKGRTFVVLDRHIADEFLKQHFGARDRNILQGSQHVASRAILGFSPSWLAAQPVAETAQGLAAVGITNQIRGLYEYGQMTPENKLLFDSSLGTTSGTSDIQFHGSQIHQIDTPGKANRISRSLEQTSTGRVVKAITTGRGASNIDRAKGLAIRRGVAAGHLTREYDKFTAGLGNLMGEGERLKGLSRQQVMEHFAKDPHARARLESYVDDVMGNWTALTHAERKTAGLVIFYPFLRMSLDWVFHSYPSRHPIKASIMHFLAQENADKLAQLTGGGPSFFPQWASAPLYDNQGKASDLVPLQRVAPGSNTVIEAVGNPSASPLTNASRALNPFLGGLATAFSGQDPLSGRVMVEHGQTVPTGLQAGLAANSVANLWTPFRALDSIGFNGKLSKGLIGKTTTPTAELYQKVGESNERKAIRSYIFPLLPESVDKVTLQANIGRLLSDKYGSDKAKASRASGLLARLYAKYHVNPSSSGSSSTPGLGSGGLGGSSLGGSSL